MEYRLETISEKKLVGKRMKMSLTDNRTRELWQSFMRQRRAIINSIDADLYSVQLYSADYFGSFNPANEFEKWAAIEVTDFNMIPDGMESLELPGGLYVVFLHKGPASDGFRTFQYIFGRWLPASEYEPDDRPHFEVLGEKYNNEDPNSEEEIWVPIRRKGIGF